jgi:hypothetical protein
MRRNPNSAVYLTAFPDMGFAMNFANVPFEPLIALTAGILILFRPQVLNYIVAIYLIVIGVLGLAPRL